MKKPAALLLLVLSVACASADGPEPQPIPVAPAPDPRVGELQTQLTELLERLDVMGSRLARLEENQAAAAAASQEWRPAPPSAQRPVTQAPARAAGGERQAALVGAQLADDYRQAIVLHSQGRHADARTAFERVFESDPTGELADNALFWIGETWFAAGDYTNALRYYNRVVNEFSDQNKAPDALFKIALTQAKSGDLALARGTLQQVIDRYPYSSTASSAKKELERIRY